MYCLAKLLHVSEWKLVYLLMVTFYRPLISFKVIRWVIMTSQRNHNFSRKLYCLAKLLHASKWKLVYLLMVTFYRPLFFFLVRFLSTFPLAICCKKLHKKVLFKNTCCYATRIFQNYLSNSTPNRFAWFNH